MKTRRAVLNGATHVLCAECGVCQDDHGVRLRRMHLQGCSQAKEKER